MQCPRCFGTDVTPIGDTHYVCNRPDCVDESGNRTQFRRVEDDRIRFPYNQIFVNRPKSDFIRKPYLDLKSPGI